MILGVGTDLVDLARFEETLARTPGVRTRLFTPAEAALPLPSLAARFAAKEALAKALGAPPGLSWQDVEVVRKDGGRPAFVCTGTVAAALERLGAGPVHLSLSHDGGLATAYVVVESCA